MPRQSNIYNQIRLLIETKKRAQSLSAIRKALPNASDRAIHEALAKATGNREGSGWPKTMYIARYKSQRGHGGAPEPVFALGTKENAPSPGANRYEVERRYRSNPKNMARILAHQRQARRTRSTGKNVFRMMTQPIVPVELPAVAVRVHECEDDVTLPPPRKYVRRAAQHAA